MREELGYRLRMVKICSGVVSNQGENDFDWVVTQMQYGNPPSDVPSYMTGAQYEVSNSNVDDEIKFQVVHPIYGVVDEFAHISAVNGSHTFEQYLAELPAGVTIRLKYIRSGNNEPHIKCNIMRHIYTR